MNFRSMFASIFGRGTDAVHEQARLLNSYDNLYAPWDGNAYDESTCGTAWIRLPAILGRCVRVIFCDVTDPCRRPWTMTLTICWEQSRIRL